MSTPIAVLLSVVIAALVGWAVHRRDSAREPAPSECDGWISEVFASGASTPDSVLLERLLAHRDRCMDDAVYVDQARRLMINAGRVADARALLAEAERRHTFAPDELRAQSAWVDIADGNADAAVATANALRARWPEWPVPYLILDEAGPGGSEHFRLGLDVRSRVLTGAAARSLTGAQAVATAFVVTLLGTLGACVAAAALVGLREMSRLPTSAIASAAPGYVELKGTLHVMPDANPVIGPRSHAPGVWYDVATTLGLKGSSTSRERSAQPFVLRDASGEALVDPRGMTVRTRHVATRFSGSNASRTTRVTERMLKEGDDAYVLGELSVTTEPDGHTVRRVRAAADGRRLLVSNLSEERLAFFARLQLWAGSAVLALAALVLVWSYVQRYRVVVPGVLR